ncbi:hypothetical protein MJH12_03915, partial [bacterium]|nr:hypothetical protein [bacterium]
MSEQKLNTPEFFGLVESSIIDVDFLKTTLDRGYVANDDFYIGTEGFVHKAIRMFEDSEKGVNHSTSTDNREIDFKGFFEQTPGKNLTFSNTQHQKTLIETYGTLNNLIQERKSYPATSSLTSGADDFNIVAILDATISKLMKVGAPGTDGVESDDKSGDANNLCNPDRFSIAIANILQNTISIADAAQGTAFEFEGKAKLNQILSELDAFKNSGPINCAESELTITRLIAESMEVSDDFLDAIAKDTEAALAMARTLGMANAAIGAQTSIEKQGLATDLADITELDAYLAKLAAANQKLRDMAKSAIDEDLLRDMLAESLKESSKSTGGTIALIGLIKGLEDEFAQSGGSFKIGFDDVLESAVGGNDINRRDFIADILKQEENDGLATEILSKLSDNLSREEIQFLIDDKFAQEGSQPRVIFVNIGEGGIQFVANDSYTVSLDASDHYDPQDPEKTDTYEYTWTVHHENPNIPSTVFSNSTSAIDLEFTVTEDFIETDPMEISLDLEQGAARVIELTIRNINTNSTTQNTALQFIFVSMLPPIAHAGNFQSVISGDTFTLDASKSYVQDSSHTIKYEWKLLDYPPYKGDIGTLLTLGFPEDKITSFKPFTSGIYTFQLTVTAVNSESKTKQVIAIIKKHQFDYPPLSADAGLNTVIATNTDYILSNASFAVNMANVTYLWSPSTNLSSATTKEPTFKSAVEGEFELTLQITDENNRVSSDKVTILVQDKKAPFVTAGNSQTLSVGTTDVIVTLDGGPSFSYLGDKSLTYAWSGVDDLDNVISITKSTEATANFTVTGGITRPSKFTLTLTITDSSGKIATETSFVRALPTVLGPVLIVEKDPIRTLYRSGDTLKLKASKSYSRSGLFLDFEYKQLSGPTVASFYFSPSGTHRENNDIVTITLPDFEEDLVTFTFLISAIDVEPSTGYPDITTSSEIITINAVPLLRKPLIRDVPDRLEVRLSLPSENPTTFTIDASNSRTLDHDGNDLRNPIGFVWTPSLTSSLLSVLNSSGTSPVFQFSLDQNNPAFQNILDKYEATILLEVTDQNTGKTEQKTIILWIYPPFHPVHMDLV